jgi:hypothetical protein
MPDRSLSVAAGPVAAEQTLPSARLAAWVDRHRWWLMLAVAAVFVAAFNGQWRIGPDSALHMTIARSLVQGEGFSYPTGYEDVVNPGLPYLIAGGFALFGVGNVLAVHVAMAVLGVASLVLVYALVRRRFDRPTAVIVMVMLAVTETFFRYSFHLLTDMPFLVGVALLLLGYEYAFSPRWALGLVMVAAGVAVMTMFRSVALTMMAALLVTLLMQAIGGGKRMRLLLVGAVALAAMGLARSFDPRTATATELIRDESRVLQRLIAQLPDTIMHALRENLPTLLTESTAEAVFSVDFGAVVSGVLAAAVLVVAARLLAIRLLWAMIVIMFFVQWLLFLPSDRYFLPILPLLLIAWWQSALWLERRCARRWQWAVLAAMVVLWMAPNVIRTAGFVVEQRRRPFLATYERGRYVAMKDLAGRLPSVLKDGDIVIASQGPVLCYFSGLPVMDSKELWRATDAEPKRVARFLSGYDNVYVLMPLKGNHQRLLKAVHVNEVRPLLESVDDGRSGGWRLCKARIKPTWMRGDEGSATQAQGGD